jgi:hypothetical protein
MIEAAKLESALFEELVNDPATQKQSVWVVAFLVMATGFGMFSRAGAIAVNICLVTTFIAWYFWSFTIYFVGIYFLRDGFRTDRKTIMRVMAFANAPGILRVLGVIPQMAPVLFVVTSVWIVAASVVGIRIAFKITNLPTVILLCAGTWLLSFLLHSFLLVILFSAFGAP